MDKKNNNNSRLLLATTAVAVFLGIAIASSSSSVGIFALAPPAFADKNNNDDQIPTVVTIPLEQKSLDPGDFILLSDTTPTRVTQAHVALNVPCHDGNNPDSDIAVVAGVAPNVKKVDLTFVSQLSDRPHHCTFHADIPDDIKGNGNTKVTDIAIINTGNTEVEFRSGNFVTLSISDVK